MPCLRYSLDMEALQQLRDLVPDASGIVAGQRKIKLSFRGAKALHAFLDRLGEDQDLLRKAAAWYYDLTADYDDDTLRLRPAAHIPPEDLPAVVKCLRLTSEPAVG